MEGRVSHRGVFRRPLRFSPLVFAALFALAALLGGCLEGREGCEIAVCPEGYLRDPVTGVCVLIEYEPDGVGAKGAWVSLAVRRDGVPLVATYDVVHGAVAVGWPGPDGEIRYHYPVGAGAPPAEGGPPHDNHGQYVSLALGPDDLPAIAYYNHDRRALEFARFDGAVWHRETVPTGHGDQGRFSSLAFDSRGRAHIAYYDATLGVLGYAVREDTDWRTEIVPPALVLEAQRRATEEPPGWRSDGSSGPRMFDYGRHASLSLALGHPVVAFYEAVGGDLLLAVRDESGWRVQFVDGRDPVTGEGQNDVGRHASLAVDGYGDVSIAYYDATEGALRFARSARGVMTIEVVDDGAIAIDGSRRPHCGRHLVGQRAALIYDQAHRPGITYLDATELTLRFARREADGSWRRLVLDETPGAGVWLDHAVSGERSLVVYAQVDLLSSRPVELRVLDLNPASSTGEAERESETVRRASTATDTDPSAVVMTGGWWPLADHELDADRFVSAALLEVLSPLGQEMVAERIFETVAARYSRGLRSEIIARPGGQPGGAMSVIGPGVVESYPQRLRVEKSESGAVEVLLELDDVTASLLVALSRATGEDLTCQVELALEGAVYRFPVVAEGTATSQPEFETDLVGRDGSLTLEGAEFELDECYFVFDESYEQVVLATARAVLLETLEGERASELAPRVAVALAPRFEFAGKLPVRWRRAEFASESVQVVPSFDMMSTPGFWFSWVAAERAAGKDGARGAHLLGAYDVGFAHTGSTCVEPAPEEPTLGSPYAVVYELPALAPGGAAWDEALVFSREVLSRAVSSAVQAGLPVGGVALVDKDSHCPQEVATLSHSVIAALWPADTPDEFWRDLEREVVVRLRAHSHDDLPAVRLPVPEPAPATESDPVAPLFLEVAALDIDVYGTVADKELCLLRIELSEVALTLVPTVDAAGALRLAVAALTADTVSTRGGLLYSGGVDPVLAEDLLGRVFESLPLLPLVRASASPPALLGALWLDHERYALLLKHP